MTTKNKIYILIGETEEIGQSEIGGPFESSFCKEIIDIYAKKSDAEKFIKSNALKKPIKKSFCGTKYYKTGHYSITIEEHYINE